MSYESEDRGMSKSARRLPRNKGRSSGCGHRCCAYHDFILPAHLSSTEVLWQVSRRQQRGRTRSHTVWSSNFARLFTLVCLRAYYVFYFPSFFIILPSTVTNSPPSVSLWSMGMSPEEDLSVLVQAFFLLQRNTASLDVFVEVGNST